MIDAVREVGDATRFIRRSPRMVAALVITFAVAVAATTTVLSVVDVVLLRPLPYRDPQRLVRVARLFPQGTPERTSYDELLDWRARNGTFDALAAIRWEDANLLNGANPQPVKADIVTSNLFQMLGVHTLLGRLFESSDEQPGSRVAILTEGTWRGAFGADPTIVGKTVRLGIRAGTEDYEIIGVLPSPVRFYELPRAAVFLPQHYPLAAGEIDPGFVYTVFGRLKPGVPIQTARDDVSRLIRTAPSRFSSPGGFVVSMHQAELGDNERALEMLALAVGLVSVIACVNIAGLVLAMGSSRRREFAIRRAIGATRGRVIRHLAIEHAVLALGGTVLAGVLTIAGIRLVLALSPPDLPRIGQLGVSWRVFGWWCGLAVATALASGFLPASLLARDEFMTAVKGVPSTKRFGRWRDGLVAAQLGLVFAVAITAALAVHSFWLLEQVPLGYDPSNVVAGQLLLGPKWQTTPRILAFQGDLLERVRRTPGIGDAALAEDLPSAPRSAPVYLPNGQLVRPAFHIVSRGYFDLLRIPVVKGGTETAAGAPPSVVVSRSFARSFLRDRVVGESLGFTGDITGVVGDTWQIDQSTLAAMPTVFRIDADGVGEWNRFWLLVRSNAAEALVVNRIQNIVKSLDPEVPIRFTTLDAEIASARTQPRFFAVLLGAFGAFGLLLAAIGVFTGIHQAVCERMRELAIRIALGAEPGRVRDLILRRIVILSALAILAGGWIGLSSARGLRTMLFGLTTTDVPTLGAAAALLVLVSATAAWGPLRRAGSIDPLVLLRDE